MLIRIALMLFAIIRCTNPRADHAKDDTCVLFLGLAVFVACAAEACDGSAAT